MGTARVNGVSLYVEEHGSGVPILGIHGTGSSALLWQGAAPALARLGRVVLYDRRGCGRSERPQPYATDVLQQTADAAAVLASLGAPPAFVIGRSYGGEIAVTLGLQHPGVVRALVLLEPSMPLLSPESRTWLAAIKGRVPPGTDPRTAAEELIEAAFGPESWPQFPEDVRDLFCANGEAIVAELHGAWTSPTAAELSRLTVPTLLVSGADSPPAFRAADAALAAMIPSVRRHVVEGGHLLDPASPEVLAFIDEIIASDDATS